ncbi:MAG TPA: saccharopine dehydrogenase NADP-binding domain-containing protein, partial [Burkholderiaceae bacterium]
MRVLVIGGYGLFGGRLAALLARQPGLQVLVGGRSLESAQALASKLQAGSSATLEAHAIDADSPHLAATLKTLRANVVVHTAGPFQGQDYHVALACIDAGAHYIDLADGREFVQGIVALNEQASRA